MKDFMEFTKKQGVLGLAVGFILGGSIQKVVSSLITNVVNPMLGIFMGKAENLKSLSFPFFGSKVLIGEFLSVLLDFVVVAFVVYFLVQKLGIIKEEEIKVKK